MIYSLIPFPASKSRKHKSGIYIGIAPPRTDFFNGGHNNGVIGVVNNCE